MLSAVESVQVLWGDLIAFGGMVSCCDSAALASCDLIAGSTEDAVSPPYATIPGKCACACATPG